MIKLARDEIEEDWGDGLERENVVVTVHINGRDLREGTMSAELDPEDSN